MMSDITEVTPIDGIETDEDDDEAEGGLPALPGPLEAAAHLLLTGTVERMPDLLAAIRQRNPVTVVVEVPGPDWVVPVADAWRLCVPVWRKDADKETGKKPPGRCLEYRNDGQKRDGWWSERTKFVVAVQLGYDVVAVSYSVARNVPEDVLRAADWTVVLPSMSSVVLTKAVTIAFEAAPSITLPDRLCRLVTATDLSLSVRQEQTADEFVARLERLVRTRQGSAHSVTLDDLHGMDEAVEWGCALAADLAEYAAGRLSWSAVDKGVILGGPPGTGKTTFAKALAATCDVPLVLGSLYRWQSMGHLGDLQKAMRKTFDEARCAAPSILFVDEMDGFGNRDTFSHDNKDYSVQVINGFLEELDGVAGREGVVVVGATNAVHRIDPAICRSGRLDKIVRIDLPDVPALQGIFRHHLKADLADVDLTAVATLALGGSGADVERWTRSARRRARAEGRPVSMDDLVAEVRGPGGRPLDAMRRCAVHEAGHAVAVAALTPGRLISVTVRETATTGGGTATSPEGHFPTREDLLNKLVVLLSGRASEEVILGEVSAGSGGSENSDLAQATSLAASMVTAYGLDDLGLVWLGEATPKTVDMVLRLRPAVEQRVTTMLTDAYAQAMALLRQHRPALEVVIEMLMDRETLSGDEVEAVVHDRVPTPTAL